MEALSINTRPIVRARVWLIRYNSAGVDTWSWTDLKIAAQMAAKKKILRKWCRKIDYKRMSSAVAATTA